MTPKDNSKDIIKDRVPESNAENYMASFIIEATK
jgi:hypothetical protein